VFPSFPIPLKVTFVKPDGGTIDTDATFNSQTGVFTASHTPDTVGKWSVVAWVGGDRIASYADSYSNSIDLNVIQYTPPETQPPPEEQAAAIPVEYIYAGVAIVVIVVAALAGYMLMKRRKKQNAKKQQNRQKTSSHNSSFHNILSRKRSRFRNYGLTMQSICGEHGLVSNKSVTHFNRGSLHTLHAHIPLSFIVFGWLV
jgi:hypothetical protein